MGTLQDVLESALEGTPYHVAVQVIVKRCEAKGAKLSARQQERLLDHLRADGGDSLRLTKPLTLRGRSIEVALKEDDATAIEACMIALEDELPRLIEEMTDSLGESILGTLRDRWPQQSRLLDRDRRGFVRRLDARWGRPLSLLRMMLAISREFGNMTSATIAKHDEDEALRLKVLTRLHARSCQVFDEIICLLTNGFADGAMARWRTLHEIAVVAVFILEHGEATAQRFLDHEPVETYRAALAYRRYSNRLGYTPMTDEDFEASKRARDEVAAKYEPKFKSDYGWAAEALGIESPGLLHIEESVGVDHLRPYYKLACHNVHASSKGSIDRLGLPGGSDVLLAGPSNAGLADPGQNTAISLYRSSVALGLLSPSLDSLVGLRILKTLTDDICQAFHAAGEELKEDAESGMAEE